MQTVYRGAAATRVHVCVVVVVVVVTCAGTLVRRLPFDC